MKSWGVLDDQYSTYKKPLLLKATLLVNPLADTRIIQAPKSLTIAIRRWGMSWDFFWLHILIFS